MVDTKYPIERTPGKPDMEETMGASGDIGESSTDLIERLKAAETGDWGLDAEIAAAIGCTKAPQSNPYNSLRLMHPNGRTIDLPAYTTSIDAALTLVPKGWYWGVDCRGIAHLDPAGTFPVVMDGLPCFTELQAATPALAICIAALHALMKEQ